MQTDADVHALVEQALAGDPQEEDGAYWQAVSALRLSRDPSVRAQALVLARSNDAPARVLAANVLAQLDAWADPRPVHPEAVEALRLLLDDPSQDVLFATLHAFGHTHDETCVPRLVRFATDTREQIRFAAVCGLGAYADQPAALDALIRASTDVHVPVRDWATFALGSLSEVDSPEVCDALLARADDEDDDTRIEAVTGLAMRRDRRVLPGLVRMFEHCEAPRALATELLEAAIAFADPVLVPALRAFRAKSEEDERALIDSAISACAKGGS